MILPASYYSGFAPRDGRPLYPSLWKGCVGAWAPCLGPTGVVLRDWSGYKRHATLTNMEPDADWVASSGQYSVEMDGTNEYAIASGLPTNGLSALTLSCWVYAIGSTNYVISIPFVSVNLNGFDFRNPSALRYVCNTTGAAQDVALSTDIRNKWVHLCLRYDGAESRAFINGISAGSVAQTGTTQSSGELNLARFGSGGLYCNVRIADVMVHNRAINNSEVTLLARRRGIAYEIFPRRNASLQAATTNRRRRLLVGASH